MKIKLKKKENSYAQVHKNMLFDRTLSLKAKGLGAILESYSNDFDVNMKSIEIGNTDGIKSIRSATKELEDGYYLFRFQVRDKGGLFTTFWVFDSERLDVNYLKNIIVGLEKIELITKNDLLQRAIPYGNAVTGMPLTACRQSTLYNNKRDNNINKNISLQKEEESGLLNYQKYKQKIISLYDNTNKPLGPVLNYESDALIILNGYIHNTYLQKDISSDDAIDVWKALYQHHISLHTKN